MPKLSIQNFLTQYRQGRVVITSRVSYNVRDLIENLVRLRHAQFEDPLFADGTEKIFYNVGWALTDNIFKHTSIGMKELDMTATNAIGAKALPLFKIGVKSYLRDTMFGEISDEARQEMISMGHTIQKIVDGVPYAVDPLNIIMPPNVESLQDGALVEQIQLTWEQLEERKGDYGENWEEIEEIWQYNVAQGKSYVTLYEYWCRDDFDGEYTKGCITYIDRTSTPEDSINDPSTWSPQLEIDRYKSPFTKYIRSKKRRKELGKDEETAYPYEEGRLFKLKGRYWGVGVLELVQGILENIQQNLNLKRKFDELQYRGITIHRQPSNGDKRTLTQEFLSNLHSGAVIDVQADETLERLQIGTITADALATNDALVQLAKMILGIAEQMSGQQMKPGITATAIDANRNLAETTYGMVIKRMSFLLRELFEDFLLKEIFEEMTMDEWMAISGDPKELIALDEIFIENFVSEEIIKAMDSGQLVSNQQVEEYRDKITKELQAGGGIREANFDKDLMKIARFGIDFVIDGENFDANQRLETIKGLLAQQTLTLNREELELEELELTGMDSKRFLKTEAQKKAEAEQAQQQQQIQNAVMQNKVSKQLPKNPIQPQ